MRLHARPARTNCVQVRARTFGRTGSLVSVTPEESRIFTIPVPADVERAPDGSWGYVVFGVVLLIMGGGWIVDSLVAPQTPPGNPTIALFFVPAGGLLVALGLYLVWSAKRLHHRALSPHP